MRYKLWFCRAKGCICSPPIRTPPSRYCISRLALCILNCTLTIQTPFQKRLFMLFISFRHLKSETNYGARNHRYTLVFQFFSFSIQGQFLHSKILIHFAFQKHRSVFINWDLTFRIPLWSSRPIFFYEKSETRNYNFVFRI